MHNYNKNNYFALVNRQPQTSENVDTNKNISFLLTGSPVAVQQEDRGPWKHGNMVGYGTDNHKGRSYKVYVMKTGCVITRTKRQVRATPILAEDYLRKETFKANRPQADDKLNELIDHFAILNQHEHLSNIEVEGKDR